MMLTSPICIKGFTLVKLINRELLLILLLSPIFAVLSLRLEVTAPLETVDEGGVFSIHCKVAEYEAARLSSLEISIFRNNTNGLKRLTLNRGLVENSLEERFFLANRQMDDGSMVYFLSVMETIREDTAVYSCKVAEASGTVLAEKSVAISVDYFPEEPSPMCRPSISALAVPCGKSITLNCTSDSGSPPVRMRWYKQSGSEIKLPYKQIQEGNIVYSELVFQPRSMDDALFICEITSNAFPGKLERCHVGPISIIWSDDSACNVPLLTSESQTTPAKTSVNSNSPVDLLTDCLNKCSYQNSSSFYWIIATIIAAIFALTFFIIVLTLAVKLNTAKPKTQYLTPRSDLYAEVENRRVDNRIYMALEKRDMIRCYDGAHDYVGTNNRRL